MALRSTIFKAEVQIADVDRGYYGDHSLTIARHPSETDERMMIRLLAFALHANDALAFGKGLSDENEPDLVERNLTGSIELWIETGLPDPKLLRRARSQATEVRVYAYGRGAPIWWNQNRADIEALSNVSVWMIPAEETAALARLAERTMKIQFTMQEGMVIVTNGEQALEIHPAPLPASNNRQ